MPPGTIVSGLEDCFATDKDSSGISGYKIDAGNNNNEFRLETSIRGDIKLVVIRTNKKLDRDEMGHSPTLDLSILFLFLRFWVTGPINVPFTTLDSR